MFVSSIASSLLLTIVLSMSLPELLSLHKFFEMTSLTSTRCQLQQACKELEDEARLLKDHCAKHYPTGGLCKTANPEWLHCLGPMIVCCMLC